MNAKEYLESQGVFGLDTKKRYNEVIEWMEGYAQERVKNCSINETLKEVIKDFLLEAQKRALTIPAVVRRSEQLVCDSDYDEFDTKDDLYAAGYDGDM